MNWINWKQKNWKFKLGIILILISIIFFALLIIIPITNISKTYKIALSSISFVLAEVSFYTGGFFIGKELFKKYKTWFNPKNWFIKKQKTELPIVDEIEAKVED
jgi:hypothetical protein